MKFKSCKRCIFEKASYTSCILCCGLPIDILACVERNLTNHGHVECLESDLINIIESMDYKVEIESDV